MANKDVFLNLSDEELLTYVAEKDECAFNILYERYRRKIFTFSMKLLKQEERAEDIVHEIFLKLWQHPNLGGIINLEAYLRVTTRNHTLKVLRRINIEETAVQRIFTNQNEQEVSETEQIILYKEADFRYREIISKMPAQQQKVYMLCKEEGLKYEEVAEKMAISKLTVKTHMQHALRYLRSNFVNYTDIILIVTTIRFFL